MAELTLEAILNRLDALEVKFGTMSETVINTAKQMDKLETDMNGLVHEKRVAANKERTEAARRQREALLDRLTRDFDKMYLSDELMQLNVEDFIELIGNDALAVESEFKVFESVVAWIAFNDLERIQYLTSALEKVRTDQIPLKDLFKASRNSLIRANDDARNMLDDAKDFYNCPEFGKMLPTKPRNTQTRQVLLAVGGQDAKGKPVDTVAMYDLTAKKWSVYCKLPHPLYGSAVVVLDDGGTIIVLGGYDGNRATKSVYKKSFYGWEKMADLPEPYSVSTGGVLLDGKVYLRGDTLKFMVYDLTTEKVTTFKPLLSYSFQCGSKLVASEPEGCLYAVNYVNGNLAASRYSARDHQWDMIKVVSSTSLRNDSDKQRATCGQLVRLSNTELVTGW